jgi:hypothetical protein
VICVNWLFCWKTAYPHFWNLYCTLSCGPEQYWKPLIVSLGFERAWLQVQMFIFLHFTIFMYVSTCRCGWLHMHHVLTVHFLSLWCLKQRVKCISCCTCFTLLVYIVYIVDRMVCVNQLFWWKTAYHLFGTCTAGGHAYQFSLASSWSSLWALNWPGCIPICVFYYIFQIFMLVLTFGYSLL